jgi:hypothetical protein
MQSSATSLEPTFYVNKATVLFVIFRISLGGITFVVKELEEKLRNVLEGGL